MYSNGDYYVGNLLLNSENGSGKYYKVDGTVLDGYFQKGQLKFLNNGHPGDR